MKNLLILAVGVVWWAQLLGHHYFVRDEIQIKMQNCSISALVNCTFVGVLMELSRPCVRLLSVLPDSSNCLTKIRIVFPLGTAFVRGMFNRDRRFLCGYTLSRRNHDLLRSKPCEMYGYSGAESESRVRYGDAGNLQHKIHIKP